jgi:hypothetical protein|nr:MAG TPA: hypothetical protein [Caudoviricetes sp.]
MILWFKHEETDAVWWKSDTEAVGEMIFSFDKKKEFNFWQDYPNKLTKEQRAIFDKENEILVKSLKG